ncbi:acyl-CoA/acyl-ACP dehydrogenase [Pusillimonas sp. MFBS29]|uniref:acyl-CoA dehydrogenase family protein n=1 Tax=Pusillimonas sp. MFBS29 TaxID=2886690 RepID=UPI001D0FA076|nr:acyl-CoA dehydrogenase family protein [Pusillimonas sp. MFBS29]MCC2596957.1 acyl-CoA/acyl-ACP dehydrogenase [Pusillimonas sp. MFBS29]
MSTAHETYAFTEAIGALITADLAPIASAIDQEGRYPLEFLRKLGAAGGFAAAVPVSHEGLGTGLSSQIEVTTQVARECGSTAFLVWCQSACAGYLQRSPNAAVRDRYLAAVSRGRILAGTGMSNAVKHLAGIENIHLKARRENDGYVVSGSLPWVSNIGSDHLIIVAASVDTGGYVMLAVRGNAEGVSLHPCPEFSGLEGTQTLNVRLKDSRIPHEDVLAHPEQFQDYLASIKPGFVLGQAGMGLGIIQASLRTIRESNIVSSLTNQFLDDQHDELARELEILRQKVHALAGLVDQGEAPALDVLRLRLATSELTLRAANSAVLHAGAKGYLMRHPAQRRQREAVFVAIVTPALKHLRKEIHILEQQDEIRAA